MMVSIKIYRWRGIYQEIQVYMVSIKWYRWRGYLLRETDEEGIYREVQMNMGQIFLCRPLVSIERAIRCIPSSHLGLWYGSHGSFRFDRLRRFNPFSICKKRTRYVGSLLMEQTGALDSFCMEFTPQRFWHTSDVEPLHKFLWAPMWFAFRPISFVRPIIMQKEKHQE